MDLNDEGVRLARDAIDDVLQWRGSAPRDGSVGDWPERDYDEIARAVLAAYLRAVPRATSW